jgi:DUF4097 and DUF4098 domain-containing protein YvlB
MESKNRNVWIIVAVVLVALCCCAAAAAVVAVASVGWFTTQVPDWFVPTSLQTERSEQTFVVGSAPTLEIESFAGNVTVRAGESGVMRVVATKKAPRISDLERIAVRMSEKDGGVVIKTEKPSVPYNFSVNLEITTPAGTDVDVQTGAGNVTVCCLSGAVRVKTGAGNFDGEDLTGRIDVHSGTGNIDYQGEPQGDCRFEVGAGNITLMLPSDLSAEVDVESGMGNVDVGFSVDGQVTGRKVQGVIGSGTQGRIYVHTGAGNIDVVPR